MKSNAIILLRFDYNINYLISFHFEDDISNISEYNDSRSREYTLYVSRLSKLELYLQFDLESKDIT